MLFVHNLVEGRSAAAPVPDAEAAAPADPGAEPRRDGAAKGFAAHERRAQVADTVFGDRAVLTLLWKSSFFDRGLEQRKAPAWWPKRSFSLCQGPGADEHTALARAREFASYVQRGEHSTRSPSSHTVGKRARDSCIFCEQH